MTFAYANSRYRGCTIPRGASRVLPPFIFRLSQPFLRLTLTYGRSPGRTVDNPYRLGSLEYFMSDEGKIHSASFAILRFRILLTHR